MSVSTYENKIKKCLEEAGRYCPALSLNIYMLACAFETHAAIMKKFAGLKSTVAEVKTRTGTIYRDHPLINQLRAAEVSILKQLKELGLTAEGTRGRAKGDALADLLETVRGETRKRRRPVKPDAE